MFYGTSGITDTKVAIYANGSDLSNAFGSCSALKTIPKLVVHEGLAYGNAFSGCSALEAIVIEGVIGNTISFSPCKNLSRASIESIISALSQTASGNTLTLSKVAVDKAFETSEGAQDGSNSDAWDALGGEKRPRQNWAVSLV
jgi:hypothetical protein